jgi:hypothetical protein
MIGNPFQYRRHFCNRNDKPQIAGGWLPQSDDVNALAINLHLESINLIILLEHLACEVAVAFC